MKLISGRRSAPDRLLYPNSLTGFWERGEGKGSERKGIQRIGNWNPRIPDQAWWKSTLPVMSYSLTDVILGDTTTISSSGALIGLIITT